MTLSAAAIPYRLRLLVFFFVLLGVTAIKPYHYGDFFLEHSLTAALIALLILLERRSPDGPLTNRSYTLIFVFMLLHVLGAHYTYSRVPYDEWSTRLLGVSFGEPLGFRRNHYDRLVHFLYGVLLIYPMRELVMRWISVRPGAALIIAIAFLAVLSKLYELLEFFVAMVMEPEAAERYNGQQGDLFDAQKDMALAFGGTLLSAAGIVIFARNRPAN